jgi:hypothetical protein
VGAYTDKRLKKATVILSEAKNLFYRDERPFAKSLRDAGLRVTGD